MAVLTDPRRVEVCQEGMAELSAIRQSTGTLTKANMRAAINGLDGFLNTNATALNNAIPLPARTALTAAQKSRLLAIVARFRQADGII